MKKEMFLLVVFLFFIPLVSAEYKEEIFDDWVYDGSNISVDGKEFLFSVSSKTAAIGITYGDERIIIRFAECSRLANKFLVCFKERKLWYRDKLDKNHYKTRIEIYEYLAKINITRKFKNTDLLIGEYTGIEVTLKNSGSLTAKNIEFNEDFPSNFSISDFSGCYLSGNSLKWKGDLGVGKKIECYYKIKALAKTDYSSKVSVKYYNGKKTVTEYSEAIDLNVPDYSLNVSFNMTDASVEIGEETDIIIILTNINKEKELVISGLNINILNGLEVTSSIYGLRKSGNKMFYSGILANTSSKKLFMTVKPEITGDYILTGNARFEIRGLLKEIEFSSSEKFNIYSTNLSIISHMPSVIRSNKKFKINISVRNPSTYSLKNVNVRIESDMPGFANESFGVISLLKRSDFINLMYKEFTAPNINEDKTYYVDVYASYTTPYFEPIHLKEPGRIEVKGAGIEITEISEINETVEINETTETPVILEEEKPTPVKKITFKTKVLIFLALFIFVIVDVILIVSIVKKLKK